MLVGFKLTASRDVYVELPSWTTAWPRGLDL